MSRRTEQKGFSLLEMLMVILIFTIVTGAVFALLNAAQQRYKMESEFLDSFQGARIALDQLTRDIHTAGYPPIKTVPAALAAAQPQLVAFPFGWNPGYPGALCIVGGTCRTPGQFDLIVETDIDPQNANGVEWVRYSLQGTTLFRGVAPKAPGDPAALTQAALAPYVENVVNDFTALPATQQAMIQASYPTMFPGGASVPIFQYIFEPGVSQTPDNVLEVSITLIVQSPSLDPKTRQPRLLTLTGLARRFNPG